MTQKLNIVILMADDHRFGSIGSTLETQVQSPNLDLLIRNGTSFERAYSMGGLTAAVCVPSRACLMTGVNTFEAVCSRQVDDSPGLQTLNPGTLLLPEIFCQAGYDTFGIGKWHNDPFSFNRAFTGGEAIFFGGMGDHFNLPIHDYDVSGAYSTPPSSTAGHHATDVFVESGMQFLRQRDEGKPFLLYISFTAPHDPRTAPNPHADSHSPEEIDITIFPNLYPEHPFDNGDLTVRDELLAPLPRQLADTRRHLSEYYAMISHLDARIGDLLACLTETGLADNTIVLYLSDHGLGLGQHGLMGKQNLYEHSLRIPCVWRGPGIPAGVKSSQLVQHMDILPTLCKLTGIQPHRELTGLPLFSDGLESPNQSRTAALSVYKNLQRCIVEHDLKLIQYYGYSGGKAELAYEQLFQLDVDPFETQNLTFTPSYQSEIIRLRDVLRNKQEEVADPLLGQAC